MQEPERASLFPRSPARAYVLSREDRRPRRILNERTIQFFFTLLVPDFQLIVVGLRSTNDGLGSSRAVSKPTVDIKSLSKRFQRLFLSTLIVESDALAKVRFDIAFVELNGRDTIGQRI